MEEDEEETKSRELDILIRDKKRRYIYCTSVKFDLNPNSLKVFLFPIIIMQKNE